MEAAGCAIAPACSHTTECIHLTPCGYQVHAVYESILDWEAFGLRVSEADIEKLPQARYPTVKFQITP